MYHVYNRGDNKELIFLDEQDYANFLKRVKIVLNVMPVPHAGTRNALRIRQLPLGSFCVLAYCLMPNHFHFLIQQQSDIPIGRFITKVCTSYAKYFNTKYGRLGNLFQDTFKAKIVENDTYALHLSGYIHANPIDPFAHPYSSLPEYIGVRQGNLCDPQPMLNYFNGDKSRYADYIRCFGESEFRYIKDLVFEE